MVVGKYQPLTLNLNLGSLTEGTSIPAPLDSPPETVRPPTPGKGPLDSHPTPTSDTFPVGSGNLPKVSIDSQWAHSGTRSPASPSGKRPGSVRKFLGLNPMSSSDSLGSDRPGSPGTTDRNLSRKKSGGWFGRRKSAHKIATIPEGRRSPTAPGNSVHVNGASTPAKTVKRAPPPPALPSLSTFGVSKDTTSLGGEDMFKDFKF